MTRTFQDKNRSKTYPLEAGVTERFVKLANSIPGVVARKRHGAGWGKSGQLDVGGCAWGLAFNLEFKRQGKRLKPTRLQEKEIEAWKAAGAAVRVVQTVAEGVEVLAACWVRAHGNVPLHDAPEELHAVPLARMTELTARLWGALG